MSCDHDHTPRGCVALIGFRGSGKSVVGRALAELLGGCLVDTDDEIVKRAGKSIAEIFADEGEATFRRMERETVMRVMADGPAVVSVGGGAVLDPVNVKALRDAAVVVWLTAPAEVLWGRIASDPQTKASRPALTESSGIEEVERLLTQRTPLYESASDLTVETSGISPVEVAKSIAALLPHHC